jgi:hypothetical protein
MSETLEQRIEREDAECTKLLSEIEDLKNLFAEVKPVQTNKPRHKETAGNSVTSRTGTSSPKLAVEECP